MLEYCPHAHQVMWVMKGSGITTDHSHPLTYLSSIEIKESMPFIFTATSPLSITILPEATSTSMLKYMAGSALPLLLYHCYNACMHACMAMSCRSGRCLPTKDTFFNRLIWLGIRYCFTECISVEVSITAWLQAQLSLDLQSYHQ